MDNDNSDLSESYLNFSIIKDILFSSSDNSDISECNTSECNINDSSSFNGFCNESVTSSEVINSIGAVASEVVPLASSTLNSTNLSHRLALLRKIVHDLRENEDEENQVFGLQLRGNLRSIDDMSMEGEHHDITDDMSMEGEHHDTTDDMSMEGEHHDTTDDMSMEGDHHDNDMSMEGANHDNADDMSIEDEPYQIPFQVPLPQRTKPLRVKAPQPLPVEEFPDEGITYRLLPESTQSMKPVNLEPSI